MGHSSSVHFERRKVSIGTCSHACKERPCIHEHACVRLHIVMAGPLRNGTDYIEIRDNLIARIAEAEHEGWLGEVEGLMVSLTGAEDELHPDRPADHDDHRTRAYPALPTKP